MNTYQPATPFHIRNLKTGISQETIAFTGQLYRGDELLATVGNDGIGGCHHFGFASEDARKEVMEYAEAMPPSQFPEEWGGGEYHRGVDGLIDLLVAEAEAFKHAKKYLTFISKSRGVEAGFSTVKIGRKKCPSTDLAGRDQIMAGNPDLLWVPAL